MIDSISLIISFVIALFIAYFFRQVLIDSMSNVHIAQEAHEYLQTDSVNITTEIDTYLYTNLSVVPKSDDDDDTNNDSDDDLDDNLDDDSDDDSDSDSDGGGSDGGDGGGD